MPPRVAQPGDLFLLLTPTGQEREFLRQQQLELQSQYGGRPVELIHITVERFTPEDDATIGDCPKILEPLLQEIDPFPVFSDQIIQFYAPYWKQYVLRWRVQKTPQWLAFKEITTLGLAEIGCPSHFVRERHATCTALFLPQKANFDSHPPTNNHRIPLFTAREVLISLLEAPESFKIIDSIKLKAQG